MLIDMMRTLYPVKRFELQVSLSPNQNIAVERHDLNEMLGIVLDNGGKVERLDLVDGISTSDLIERIKKL